MPDGDHYETPEIDLPDLDRETDYEQSAAPVVPEGPSLREPDFVPLVSLLTRNLLVLLVAGGALAVALVAVINEIDNAWQVAIVALVVMGASVWPIFAPFVEIKVGKFIKLIIRRERDENG